MTRYKKASFNEYELEQIDGVTPVLRPTRDEVFEVLTVFRKQQTSGVLDDSVARKVLSKLLYNSLFLWKDNKRTTEKEAGAEDLTEDDIDDFVIKNLFEVWINTLDAFKFVNKKELLELAKKEQEKKLKELQGESESAEDPN